MLEVKSVICLFSLNIFLERDEFQANFAKLESVLQNMSTNQQINRNENEKLKKSLLDDQQKNSEKWESIVSASFVTSLNCAPI